MSHVNQDLTWRILLGVGAIPALATFWLRRQFSPHTTLSENMLYTLLIFVIAALPGYIVAAFTIDRIGRKRLQLLA